MAVLLGFTGEKENCMDETERSKKCGLGNKNS
jgi:hypothetical protein